jgi:hypothetical protein
MARPVRRRIAGAVRRARRRRRERHLAAAVAGTTTAPADRMWQDVRDAFLPRLDRST